MCLHLKRGIKLKLKWKVHFIVSKFGHKNNQETSSKCYLLNYLKIHTLTGTFSLL